VEETVGKPVTCVLVSVGVGSWAHAVTAYYKSKGRPVTVIAVEPTTAACLQTSLKAGKIVPIETGQTIMNGMCCGTVSDLAWPVLQKGVDASVTITDMESHQMVQYLRANGVDAGPCGAAPLAALKQVCGERALGLGHDTIALCLCSEGYREYAIPNGS
jgi:diaminopropionate ammonia-lyase